MTEICYYRGGSPEALFRRVSPTAAVTDAVRAIVEDVRLRGDLALLEYCEKFDGGSPESLELPKEEWYALADQADKALVAVMERAAENIRAFHSMQRREGFELSQPGGIRLGQRVLPLDRAALYIPGGTASYPSTVLMNAIPARVAGVREIVMTSPARGGQMNPDILAAARIAGVDRVFRMGGAQAVAALAYGTESVPRADKIVGPGNAYVAEAKRQIFGQAGIDRIAGPSEILILADAASDPARVAADLLSQAEHDTDASALLLTDSEGLAKAVAEAVEAQLSCLPREAIARQSMERNGRIIVTETMAQAIELSNLWAPEHLELCVEEPFALLPEIRHAGSVFLGRSTAEAIGDYWAGCNHTLPTGGTARYASPLSVDDFVKKTQYIYYSPEAAAAAAEDIALFARREGLEAHARSALKRKEGQA